MWIFRSFYLPDQAVAGRKDLNAREKKKRLDYPKKLDRRKRHRVVEEKKSSRGRLDVYLALAGTKRRHAEGGEKRGRSEDRGQSLSSHLCCSSVTFIAAAAACSVAVDRDGLSDGCCRGEGSPLLYRRIGGIVSVVRLLRSLSVQRTIFLSPLLPFPGNAGARAVAAKQAKE